jgi:hypothetical protein
MRAGAGQDRLPIGVHHHAARADLSAGGEWCASAVTDRLAVSAVGEQVDQVRRGT